MEQGDVIVIGAGVAGSAVARELVGGLTPSRISGEGDVAVSFRVRRRDGAD